MVGCSIRNCKSRSVKDGTIRFFSFPKQESVANVWLRYCGPKTTTKNGRVCSNHFSSCDYFKSLRHILLNESPRKVRNLKPDAIPTLQIDDLDRQNMTMSIDNTEKISEIVGTSGNITEKAANVKCFSESHTAPATEGASSSEVVENRQYDINIISPNKKNGKGDFDSYEAQAHEVACSSEVAENSKYQIKIIRNVQCDFNNHEAPADEVAGSSDVVEKSKDQTKAPILIVLGDFDSKEAPTDGVADPLKNIEKGDDEISIPRSEYKVLKRKAREYNILKNNLDQIFTPGQIRCLKKPDMRRVRWNAEDIAAAISLRNISPKGYHYLKTTVGIPLPGYSTLYKWVSKFDTCNRGDHGT